MAEMRPEDVPDELVSAGRTAWREAFGQPVPAPDSMRKILAAFVGEFEQRLRKRAETAERALAEMRADKPEARCQAVSNTRLRLQCSRPEGHDAAHVADLDGMGRFSWHGDTWCGNQHPDHPLPCGRYAGHEGPHVRGERRWADAAEQQPEGGDRG